MGRTPTGGVGALNGGMGEVCSKAVKKPRNERRGVRGRFWISSFFFLRPATWRRRFAGFNGQNRRKGGEHSAGVLCPR